MDHALPAGVAHPTGRLAAEARLDRLVADALPVYSSARDKAMLTGEPTG